MKFSENSSLAADYLRQAVPKMVKHNIVPNPLNYTLWYSYYSNEFPKLNQELDHLIERFNTCPIDIGETLFLEHMTNLTPSSTQKIDDFQNALSNMVINLSETLGTTAQDSRTYAGAMNNNIDSIQAQDVSANTASLLVELKSNSEAICRVNEDFQRQLDNAQAQIERLKQDLKNSREEATTDPLTGLSNRRVMANMFDQFWAGKNSQQLCVIMLDIDHFKAFNDKYGHLMGDQILKVVASLLKKESPTTVTPVRFGGEEFVLFCPKMNESAAQDLAENIRIKLAAISFNNKKNNEKIAPVTASFGVAMRKGNEVLDDMIERADNALYFAKKNGRNRVELAARESSLTE